MDGVELIYGDTCRFDGLGEIANRQVGLRKIGLIAGIDFGQGQFTEQIDGRQRLAFSQMGDRPADRSPMLG